MRILNVQGLRAIAALLVVGAHEHDFASRFGIHSLFDTLVPFEAWGVDLFFVISGFVMITVHGDDFGRRFASFGFLLRRFIRVFPLYWLITLVLFATFALAPSLVHHWQSAHANLLESLLLIPQQTLPLLWVGWTLVFEMYFYYVFALVLVLPRAYGLGAMAAWVTLVLILQFTGRPLQPPALELATNGLVIEFAIGVVVGLLVKYRRLAQPELFILAGCVALVAHYFAVRRPGEELFVDQYLRFFFVGVPMGFVVYGAVALELRRRLVFPPFLQYLGNASYSIYLSHSVYYVAVGRLTESYVARHHVPAALLLFAVPLAVVAGGCAMYTYLETPLLAGSRALAERLLPRLMSRPSRRAEAA